MYRRGAPAVPPQTTITDQRGDIIAAQWPERLLQQSQHQFPSTEQHTIDMAPISGQTPQQRPPLTNQTHTRTSSFFSFRSKQPSESQINGPQRATSIGKGDKPGVLQRASPQSNSLQGSVSPVPQPMSPPQHAPQQQQAERPNGTSPLARSPSNTQRNNQSPPASQPPAAAPPLHPEIRSVVHLTAAHAHKIYFSGPLIRRIERQADGQRPAKDDGWADVWAQLGGTTLSIWDMKQIQEASKMGKEVPPTYVNTTDAFIQVLGSVTVPETPTSPSKKYTNVITLNTAGSNLLLFSCPSTAALISWAAALRLSAWEKSRLEEIYTAHLIRITLSARDVPTTLAHGSMEGWVRIRIAGQTDWKRVWMSVYAGTEGVGQPIPSGSNGGGIGGVPTPVVPVPKKKRMSSLFSRDSTQQSTAPMKAMISIYASPKPKDKKKALLTIRDVTQTFAVYPERPELISRSTLIKVEGLLGDEEMAAGMRSREGWILIMPELEGGLGQAAEMLKWVVALHDAFELYGRPEAWTWDPRDPVSLMFAYPVGPSKDLLFLDRELAESLDPRDDRTSAVRSRLIGILLDRMRGHDPSIQPPRLSAEKIASSDKAPSLPLIGAYTNEQQSQQSTFAPSPKTNPAPTSGGPQLPPLSFGGSVSPQPPQEKKPLSPITERSSGYTNGRAFSSEVSSVFSPQSPPNPVSPSQEKPTQPTSEPTILANAVLSSSPTPVTRTVEPPANLHPNRQSFDSPSGNRSRFDSNTSSTTNSSKPYSDTGVSGTLNPANVQLPLSPVLESRPVFQSSSSHAPEPRPRSPHGSVLTSPHSIVDHDEPPSRQLSDRASDRGSVLTSPHSPQTRNVELTPIFTSRTFGSPATSHQVSARAPLSPPPQPQKEERNNISDEAGALFYMQHSEPDGSNDQNRRIPPTITEQDDDTSSSSSHHDSFQPTMHRLGSPINSRDSKSPPIRQNTPMAFVERPSSKTTSSNSATGISVDRVSPTSRPGLGRKPSGARAQATRPYGGDGISSSRQVTEEEETYSEDHTDSTKDTMDRQQSRPSAPSDDPNLDALAALSYLAVDDEKPVSPKQVKVEPLNVHKAPSPPPVIQEQFKSSFAPSKQAAERKAKAQAQQAAHHAAVHKPGRANGKRKSMISGTWNESSDEEDEDEEDEEDEVDSDAEPSRGIKPATSLDNSLRHPQNQGQAGEPPMDASQGYSHLRPPRTLPQIPANHNYSEDHPPPRRIASDQFTEQGRRTHYDGTQIRTQAEFPQPGVARQSMWSQVLEQPGRTTAAAPEASNTRDTFVQLDTAETMTKAFTPQGLLSAGMQDKQDRSAKRQEELARETGASLINVPNKLPPPQMGLLGAITAHERERKREGGVGAALTEREREKRLAEDRQRRFDDQQRQQLEQMQQGGSMYGGQFPGFNPMMGNPMMMMNQMNPMMGMNPMMTGGGLSPMMTGGMAPMMTGQMGFPGMMPGYNPQHMFAAQQAAQAYQQAMMAFSVAGSQVGGEAGIGPSQLNPAMTGGNMSGFDPRMSMMGMPMMGAPPMGTSPMAGMGMQMTGMSGFDPRFSPNMNNSPQSTNDPSLTPGTPNGPGQGHFQTQANLQVGRGSPLARIADTGEGVRESSRPTSPKP